MCFVHSARGCCRGCRLEAREVVSRSFPLFFFFLFYTLYAFHVPATGCLVGNFHYFTAANDPLFLGLLSFLCLFSSSPLSTLALGSAQSHLELSCLLLFLLFVSRYYEDIIKLSCSTQDTFKRGFTFERENFSSGYTLTQENNHKTNFMN